MLVSKALIQDEVVVTLEGMTIDTGIVVTMISYEFLQFYCSLRQRLDGECHIFNETRGADWACASHAGEYA